MRNLLRQHRSLLQQLRDLLQLRRLLHQLWVLLNQLRKLMHELRRLLSNLMRILHELWDLLGDLLQKWIAKWTELSNRTAIPGLRRDLRSEPSAESPTRLGWVGRLRREAVLLSTPIQTGKPRIHLSIRIKHRYLL